MSEITTCMKKGFEATILKSEVVCAALPVQEHVLPLSNLDLLLPAVDVSVFFCYVNNSKEEEEQHSFRHVVGLLKKALAQTLVSYYAFAGVLVKNEASEPELLCNNRGVDFIEAYADVELRHVDFYDPDKSVEGKLVPKRTQGVLAVQATELKCGAVVLSCTFSHQIADAYSANMFLVSWAEMARSKTLSHAPSFRRSILFPRRPIHYHSSVDQMYVPVSSLTPPDDDTQTQIDEKTRVISRIYHIKSDHINHLQALANGDETTDPKRTKLEAFCAYLWKMIASTEGTCDDDRSFKLGIVVDGRRRLLTDVEDERESKSIASYFGNVLSVPFGVKKISELKNELLRSVADEVHDFLRVALTKEHFLGLVDWVEEHRPEQCLARIYASENERAVVVSSGQGFPVRKMDFGWGLPAFGSYHFPWGSKSGYIMPMPSPKGDGDWIVYMHLMKDHLDLVETNAGHVFVPLTSDYIFSEE